MTWEIIWAMFQGICFGLGLVTLGEILVKQFIRFSKYIARNTPDEEETEDRISKGMRGRE